MRVGFGRRATAMMLDDLAVLILNIVALIIFMYGAYRSGVISESYIAQIQNTSNPEDIALPPELKMYGQLFMVWMYSVPIITCFLPEVLVGSSLGKHLLGIRIGTSYGTRASKKHLFVRAVLKRLPMLLYILYLVTGNFIFTLGLILTSLIIGIGYFAALGEERQTLHDKWADTAVFYTEDLEEDDDSSSPLPSPQPTPSRSSTELLFK